jgi:hypothetical protein
MKNRILGLLKKMNKNRIVAFNDSGARIFINPSEEKIKEINSTYSLVLINPNLENVEKVPPHNWTVNSDMEIIPKKEDNDYTLPIKALKVKEVIKEVIVEKPIIVEKEVIKEIIKEVPVEVIKEVIKEVEVEKKVSDVIEKEVTKYEIKEIEVIKEVPVKVVEQVPVEVIKEIIKEVEVVKFDTRLVIGLCISLLINIVLGVLHVS